MVYEIVKPLGRSIVISRTDNRLGLAFQEIYTKRKKKTKTKKKTTKKEKKKKKQPSTPLVIGMNSKFQRKFESFKLPKIEQ
jgi:hypothetical protein